MQDTWDEVTEETDKSNRRDMTNLAFKSVIKNALNE